MNRQEKRGIKNTDMRHLQYLVNLVQQRYKDMLINEL